MLKNIPSIIKKQIVAITGLGLVLFLIAHLAGNMLIYVGAEAFNAYAEALHNLGPLLWVARIGLIVTFLVHISFTAVLVLENRKARTQGYAVNKDHTDKKSIAVRLMPITGSILILYVVLHLIDFTFKDKSIYANGLYELVTDTLMNPIHAIWYMVAMACVGFHLSHGIQSVAQTFGVNTRNTLPKIQKASLALGLLIAIGFGSIPLYIMLTMNL